VRADDAAAEIGAAEVRREHVVPLVDVDLPEGADDGAGGVVDEHVHVAGRREQALPRLEAAHVVLDRLAADLRSDRLGALEVEVGEEDAVAVGCEPPRDRLAQSLRRSRDDGGPGH
jgi:hypothetical protein